MDRDGFGSIRGTWVLFDVMAWESQLDGSVGDALASHMWIVDVVGVRTVGVDVRPFRECGILRYDIGYVSSDFNMRRSPGLGYRWLVFGSALEVLTCNIRYLK